MSGEAGDYYSRINGGIVGLVPHGTRRILEVGCGAGALAGHLKGMLDNPRYVGIEISEHEAAKAASVVDRVFVGDAASIESGEIKRALAGRPDCVIYGDVIEHLVDPWCVLQQHADLLDHGGVVVASIPNIQYWRVAGRILTDAWRYQEQGPFDRGHLRWFTRSSVLELFAGAGLAVEKLLLVKGQVEGLDEYCRGVRDLVLAAGMPEDAFRALSGTVQFLVLARKAGAGAG